jgi:hypothetical protein
MKYTFILLGFLITACSTSGAPYGYTKYCEDYPQDVICGGTQTK